MALPFRASRLPFTPKPSRPPACPPCGGGKDCFGAGLSPLGRKGPNKGAGGCRTRERPVGWASPRSYREGARPSALSAGVKAGRPSCFPFPPLFLPRWGTEGVGLRRLRSLLCTLARRFLLLLSPGAYFSLRRRWFNRSMRVTRPRNWSPSMTMGTRPWSKRGSRSLMGALGERVVSRVVMNFFTGRRKLA